MPRKSQRTQRSQPNQSGSLLTQQTLEETFAGGGEVNINFDEQTSDLVRYFVNRAGDHMIFKRADIKKHVLPKAGPHFQKIIDDSTKILRKVYGYNVIVIDAVQNSSKAYIVSNALPYLKDPTEQVQECPEDVHKILMLLILAHVFMANNCVSELSLYTFLKSFQIDPDRRHELFGNVKDYIHITLKNKKYLTLEMDQLSKKISISWGPRAEKEISKHEILKFVCKMYKDRAPNSWVNQHKVANEQHFENHRVNVDIPTPMEEE
ncbi:unnamed protein product [Phaedon cochleariae]|uniref:MAGE domain-containing protein n=1 Tax=Phaedon cochleariae TaxID=80249 RepID=A0A9P0DNR6_PHACE|nr:unnamed protein product [Phaedon cochleariae]